MTKLLVDNPNFTLVMPGSCQAKCSFCFWNKDQKQDQSKFLHGLIKALPILYKYKQLSISGGEPTLSPILHFLPTIIDKSQLDKVVITTNGADLDSLFELITTTRFIDHVNISRHAINDNENEAIFGTSKLPSIKDIAKFSTEACQYGVDVTFNCVLEDSRMNSGAPSFIIHNFAKLAKECNVSSICFRRCFEQESPHNIEKFLSDNYKVIKETSCPVCSYKEYLVCGLKISVRTSVKEPSNQLQGIYEFILQPNGDLTSDWKGENIIDNKGESNPEPLKGTKKVKVIGSCGSVSYKEVPVEETEVVSSYVTIRYGCGNTGTRSC